MAEEVEKVSRPRTADVAFWLTLVVAAAVLAIAGLVPTQIAPTIDRSRSAANAQQVDVPALEHGLVLLSIVLIVIGVIVAGLLVLFAFRVRSGHRRARIGLVVITVLLIASLNAPLIVAAVVLVVADVLLFLPPVAEWLRAVAPKRALRRR